MGLYRELLRHLSETDPARLEQLPRELIDAEAAWLLQGDDLYLLEQVGKRRDVGSALSVHERERKMYQALTDGRVDDFCYLFKTLQGQVELDHVRVAQAYAALAVRGNVSGLEEVVKKTGIRAHLDEPTALRAYEVLIAMGRLGAVDYVRQLSGVPVTFSERSVQAGYTLLLFSGRYATMRELRRQSGIDPVLNDADLTLAFQRAVEDLQFSGLAILAELTGRPVALSGFTTHLDRIVLTGRFNEIPSLFRLCADARAERVSEELLLRMLESADPAAATFIYSHDEFATFQRRHAEAAYRLGVSTSHRALVQAVCERTGQGLRASDAALLLASALDEVDPDWIEFAHSRLADRPALGADRVQAFLYELHLRADARLDPMQAVLASRLDEPVARWLHHLKHGRFDEVARGLSSVKEHPLVASLGPVLAVLSKS